MDPRTEKIALACFPSGMLTLLGLLIMVPTIGIFGLAIGTLLGAGLGYLGYEFREVLRAILVAWALTIRTYPLVTREFIRRVRLAAKVVPCPVVLLSDMVPLFLLIGWFRGEGLRDLIPALGFALVSVGGFGIILGVLLGTAVFWIADEDNPFQEMLRDFNPITVYGYYTPLGILFMVRRMPQAFTVGVRFVKYLFLLVHSKERLVCAVDGPAGALVTYLTLLYIYGPELSELSVLAQFSFVGLAGAVSALIGMVNYELLSKRVLEVVPMRVETK